MKINTHYLSTVAAISTPFGKGGVSMLRVSGCDAIEIASRVFYPASGLSLETVGGRCAVGASAGPFAVVQRRVCRAGFWCGAAGKVVSVMQTWGDATEWLSPLFPLWG